MAEGNQGSDTIDIVDNTSVRIKTLLGGAGVLIAAIATGAMEFRDIRNDILDIKDDKLTQVAERHNQLKVRVSENKDAIKELDEDTDRTVDQILEQIRGLSARLNEVESNLATTRRAMSQVETAQDRQYVEIKAELQKLNEKVSTLKDDVLKLTLRSQ